MKQSIVATAYVQPWAAACPCSGGRLGGSKSAAQPPAFYHTLDAHLKEPIVNFKFETNKIIY